MFPMSTPLGQSDGAEWGEGDRGGFKLDITGGHGEICSIGRGEGE